MDEMEQQIMFEMSKKIQEQKQSTETMKFQIEELLQSQAKLQKNLETMMPRFFSHTSIPPRPPSQPPDPPDFNKSNPKPDPHVFLPLLSELMSLKQHDDSVETYLEKFDCSLSQLSLSMPYAVNIFLSNMNPHLASRVKQFDVTTVAYAAWLAKLFESSLLHTSAIQPRAPFSPNQNQNNQGLTDEIVFDKDNTAWLLNGVVTQQSKIEFEVESIETGSSIQQIESSDVKDVMSTDLVLNNESNPAEESRPEEASTHKADSVFGEETITSNASESSQVSSQVSLYHLPVFDGTFPDYWIAEVDRFFELQQYGNEDQLDLIYLSVEGAALKWFRRHRREFTDWTDIKRKLMARFGPVKGCSPPEVLPKEKLITKGDQDTDFGSEKESTNSVGITSIKGHEVQGTTVSHSATSCVKQIHQNEEFPHLHVTVSTSKLSRNLSLIMHQVNNSVVENQKKLARKVEIPIFENLHEPSRRFDDESQGILGDHTLVPMKPYQSYSQSWYEPDTIQSDINFKVLVAHECDMVGVVVIYEVATTFEKLAKTWKFKFKSNPERSKLLDDMFSFMEKSSEKYVMVRESHHRLLESQQGNGLSLLNCLIAHDVLRPSSSEYTKHTLILVYHLCSLSSSRLFVKIYAGCIVALLMVYDAERLIQSNAPPIFSDLLCVKNRIRVRLKMVLLLEFLWLILFSSKIFKSSNVHQNKNQTDQKRSSYWKLLLRLLYPLHNNEWRSFYMLMIKSAFKGKEKTVSFNIAVTSCSRFCFFSYSSWMGSHNRYDLSSCVLRQDKNYVIALFPIGEALTLVNDQHTLVAQKKGTETSTGCCYGFHADLDLMADVTAGTADISMDEFSSVCKLLFGVFVLNLIADQVRDWSFFGLLLQWKWHPPPQATSEFHQAHNDKPVFHL